MPHYSGHDNPSVRLHIVCCTDSIMKKISALKRDYDPRVVVMWECEWERQKKTKHVQHDVF